MDIQSFLGKKLESFSFEVERGKVKELADALGESREEYLSGEKLLPTFPTVIEYWGSGYNAWFELGLDKRKTLHGEQEYEYIGKIRVGDTITVHSEIIDAYIKASMNFLILKKEYFNDRNELVLRSHSTIIERH